jgi:hypothetical protein
MARSWLSITVELVEGNGERFWPRPGRIFAASRAHTFAQLAEAIEAAFARWDRAHLHEFTLADMTRLATPFGNLERGLEGPLLDDRTMKLSHLSLRERFLYLFDYGDGWLHLCTVAPQCIDALETLGPLPSRPLPFSGWGELPDQYGRRFADDDGASELPPNPGLGDLPPLRPWWGPQDESPRR